MLFSFQISIIIQLGKSEQNIIILKNLLMIFLNKQQNRLVKAKLIKRIKDSIQNFNGKLKIENLFQEEEIKQQIQNVRQQIEFERLLDGMNNEEYKQSNLRGPRQSMVLNRVEKDNYYRKSNDNKEGLLVQEIIYNFYEDLKQHFEGLGIQIRFLLNMIYKNNKQSIKQQLLNSIISELKFDQIECISESEKFKYKIYNQNLQQIKNILLIFIRKNKNFKNLHFQKLYSFFHQQTQKLLDQFLYLDYQHISTYQQNHRITCLKIQTLKQLKFDINQQYGIIKIDRIVESVNLIQFQSRVYQFCKNNEGQNEIKNAYMNDIQKEMQLLNKIVTINVKEFLQFSGRTKDYLICLSQLEYKFYETIKFVQKQILIKQMNKHWLQIEFQTPLFLKVEKNKIQLNETEGFQIKNLNNFVQYIASSQFIITMIQKQQNLYQINNIFFKVLQQINQSINKLQCHAQLFIIIKQKIYQVLFKSYLIKQGRSQRDKKLYLKMSGMDIKLKDVHLEAFNDEQKLILDIIDEQTQDLNGIFSPNKILGFLNNIVTKIQYILKLSNNKFIVAGDQMICIIQFVIIIKKIKNLSSLINYIKAFFIAGQKQGNLQYLLSLLEGVLMVIQRMI